MRLRRAGMGSEASLRTISTASASIARQTATNSSTSRRRSPFSEAPGDLSLGEPGRLPGTFEKGEEAFLGGSMDRLAHASGLG